MELLEIFGRDITSIILSYTKADKLAIIGYQDEKKYNKKIREYFYTLGFPNTITGCVFLQNKTIATLYGIEYKNFAYPRRFDYKKRHLRGLVSESTDVLIFVPNIYKYFLDLRGKNVRYIKID